ncbi:deoxycytidylate deaminase-like protein [Sarcoptes scabiei]|uniref:Probable deoxycytidylate deaminase n=2 Tax=Sarcoptes scabiei TaxID=52283 RepID=A0A131ZY38_SARSC|nr:deoxycytidylate deaminase-like protein [Sarcoptes scabiei]
MLEMLSNLVTLVSRSFTGIMSEKELAESSTSLSNNETSLMVTKRKDYLCWWDYFMSMAYIASMRSKDPNTQVGACIVNEDNRIVGLGYNGMPNHCSDDDLPWNRVSKNPLNTKYLYVCHAEMNAILNKNSESCKNCSIFVIMFPCNECSKMIIQSGIKRVVYLCDKYPNDPKFQSSRFLLEMAGIEIIQYTPKQRKVVIDFNHFLDQSSLDQ